MAERPNQEMRDEKTFVVETEAKVVRRYSVVVREDENPWDVWDDKNRQLCIIDEKRGEELPMSVADYAERRLT